MTPLAKIYTIYTADEKVTVHHLLKHLKSITTTNDTKIWYDDSIKSGKPWKPSDKSRLYDTDIFVLVVNNTFMYSEFIKQLEFKIIIDRYKAGTCRVIPLILENCPWDIDFEADDYIFNFNELHVLPAVGRPVRNWESTNKALEISAMYIKEVITSLIEGRSQIGQDLEDANVISDEEDQLSISFSEEEEARRMNLRAIEIKEEAAKKKAEQQRLEAEYLDKKRAEEVWFQERMETMPETVGVDQTNIQTEADLQEGDKTYRRNLFIGTALLAVVLAMGTFYYKITRNPDPSTSKQNAIVATDRSAEESSSATLGAGATMATFRIGGLYKNGMIFKIDEEGKNGIVAHLKDAGPMTWNEAMKIHEQLGKGWRLPTLDELTMMYNAIGPGSDNSGKFANGLYWSATPYDSNQARLVRFEDGNTTFHYNSVGTFRKFLVRAVRDVEQ